MRSLLTPALADQNPKAYIAHFRRLEADAQRQYLAGLTVDELQRHFRATGDPTAVGLLLSVELAQVGLEATVGGSPLGVAAGLDEARALQARALELGQRLGSKAISGLLKTSLGALDAVPPVLSALGWSVSTVSLAGDPGDERCRPALSWSLRGQCGEGSFYMPGEALPWDTRAAAQARLEVFARGVGAVVDARVG